MPVDRCVCAGITFDELLRNSREHPGSLDDLKRRTGCCLGCVLCEPYLRLAILTGQTSFEAMRDDELANRILEAGSVAERSSRPPSKSVGRAPRPSIQDSGANDE